MNRRGFLGSLISAGLAAAVDPERLLWEPGKKLISVPKPAPILSDGWLNAPIEHLRIGDVFSIAGKYAVNPLTREVATYYDVRTGKREPILQLFTVVSIEKSGPVLAPHAIPDWLQSS